MHLEGSLTPNLLFDLAARNSISLPSSTDDPSFASPASLLDRYARFTSLDDFLHYYFIGMSALIHTQDFEDLAWAYFVRAKDDGIVHAEVFFDPQAHTSRGLAYVAVVEGFTKACKRAEKELGISTKLILCFLRHLPVKNGEEMLVEARNDLASGLLSGVGLDSSEKGFPPRPWQGIYETVANLGARLTAHAGEEGSAEYVKEALDLLHVERIDHGIRLVDDEKLMHEVAKRKILITVCPLSNVRLRCVKDVKDLPVRKFLDKGVRFSINSDDPAYFGGYIYDNYCAVQEAFSLTIKEWEYIAQAAVEGSWCDDSRKQTILKEVDEVVRQYSPS